MTASAAADRAGQCAACGSADPLGLDICPFCAAVARGGRDALIVLRRARGRDRADAVAHLAAVFGPAAATPAGRAAVRGGRALMRVPRGAAAPFLAALESRGIAARAIAADRALALAPAHFWLLVAAILVVGILAAADGLRFYAWSSPLLALTLLLAGHSSAARPALTPRQRTGRSSGLRPAIDTLAALPPGRAHDLLADLLALARPLLSGGAPTPDTAPIAAELLGAAAATAAEVDRLDRIRAALERHDDTGLSTIDVAAAITTCDRAGRTGVARLEAAVAALAAIGTAATGPGVGEDLSRLTSALERDATAQAAAAREIAELLRPTG
jgi:hypothetical protein